MSYYKGAFALKLATAASYAFLCAVASANAQEATSTSADVAEVSNEQTQAENAQSGTSENEVVELDALTIVAGRKATSVLDVPANVTIVGSDDIEQYGISDVQQAVRYIPGLEVTKQTSATDAFNSNSGFTIRGVSGNRVLMLTDGSRVPERITDGTRDYLDFNFLKQVEVVRGPASVLWGADALGGVVATETIDPEDLLKGRKMGGQAGVSFDSFTMAGTAKGAVGYRLSDSLTAMIAYARGASGEATLSNARADGGIYGCPRDFSAGQLTCNKFDDTDIQSHRTLAKLVWAPSVEHRLELSADLLRRSTAVDYTGNLGAETGGGYTNSHKRNLDLARSRYALEHLWTPDAGLLDEVKTVFAYTPNEYDRTGTRLGVTSGSDNYVKTDSLTYTENLFELDVQASKFFQLRSSSHDVIFGFDGDYSNIDYSRIDRTTNLTTNVTTEARAGGFNFANADTIRADLYLQDTVGLFGGALEVTPGVRFATFSLDPRPDDDYQVVAGKEPQKRSDTALLKSLGAQYHLNETWSVWGKYGEGFKMPTAQQLFTSLSSFNLIPAPDLKPEEVKSYEIGVRAQRDNGYIALNGFYSDYTDFIQSFYNPPGTSYYTYRNLSSVNVWGLELEGAYSVSDTLHLNGRLSWQRGIQKASKGADAKAHTLPPLKAVVGVNYLIPDYNLSFEAVTTLAAPVAEVSSATGFKPGGYALLDVFGNWQFSKMASLNVGVKNVFDTRYFDFGAAGMSTSPSTSVAKQNPLELQTGAGRTFSASLNIEF